MAKMTKAQKKRMVVDIESKAKKLWLTSDPKTGGLFMSVKDMETIEKLCKKWLKRIG